MASTCEVTLVFLVLALACAELSTCHVVSGTVSCLDCSRHHLSGVGVAIKCSREEKVIFVSTDETGSFKAKLPATSSPTPDCYAMLVTGPNKHCSFKKAHVSKLIKSPNSSSFIPSTPLSFTAFACAIKINTNPNPNPNPSTRAKPDLESSKTVDLPLPPEWGLAPSSYYIPFVPIIGIP